MLVPKLMLALDGLSSNFASRAKDAHDDPSVSHVHALRVLTRRLRSHLWLIPKADRSLKVRKVLRSLKILADVLGEQRKYDIALKDAIEFSLPTEEIEARRSRSKRKVRTRLTRINRQKLTLQITSALEDVRENTTDDILLPRLKALSRRLRREGSHSPRNEEAGHRVRIDAKKARYLLETFGKPMARLDELQDHLGRWHDLLVLDEMIGPLKKVSSVKDREWKKSLKRMKPILRKASKSLDSLC